MSKDALLTTLVTIALFLVGGIASLVVYIIRASARWATMETRLTEVIKQIEKLVQDKDQTHRDIVAKLEQVSASLNARVRWLEEYVWNQKKTP